MLICFDIGAVRIKAVLARDEDDLMTLGDAPTPREDFDRFVEAMLGFVAGRKVQGIAISIAGAVDSDSGRVSVADIPCLDGRTLGTDLAEAMGLPVLVLKDTDCFALAEAGSGAGMGHRTVFAIVLGANVGGGLVIDDQIVNGAGGIAGEWGHGPVLNRRPLGRDVPHYECACGQVGCVDTIGGVRGIERLHAALHGERLTAKVIFASWQAGDKRSVETLDIWLDMVAGPLAMVLNVVGASIVPVGGVLGAVPELVTALDQAVRARILRRVETPLLVPARHRVEPCLVGVTLAGFRGLASGVSD